MKYTCKYFKTYFLILIFSCFFKDIFSMDRSGPNLLNHLLKERKNYELQQAIYDHLDKFHSPWIGEWLSQTIKKHWYSIELRYFQIRWFLMQNKLNEHEIFAFFENLMIFSMRCFVDTFVCYKKGKIKAVENYDFIVHDKMFRWTENSIDCYGKTCAAVFWDSFAKTKEAFGVTMTASQQNLSCVDFFQIYESPAIMCSIERSLWRYVGIYPDTIYFMDPSQSLIDSINSCDAFMGDKKVDVFRKEAIVKFVSFLNWIIFDKKNTNLSNTIKWKLIFSKSFYEIAKTEWLINK